jgi:hypothetical protein
MIAVRIECIDVEASRARQACAHFIREHAVTQTLRFAEFLV